MKTLLVVTVLAALLVLVMAGCACNFGQATVVTKNGNVLTGYVTCDGTPGGSKVQVTDGSDGLYIIDPRNVRSITVSEVPR